ncbi:hypothetical protein AB0E83_05590 [Streptomyces sp. NPDC035033]|uniref:hypothetical protein n=1 Tax=Streptomyces sp. NPDC035033 TaxID=3155368 RepID=UPI0033EBBCA9
MAESSRRPRKPFARPRPSRPLAAFLLATGVLLAGCSSGEPAASAGTKPLSDPSEVSVGQLVYPLDPYRATDEQIRSLEKAQDLLTADCMKRYGFGYEAAPPPPARSSGTSYRYGVADEETAARYGYAKPGTDAEREKPNEALLPPDERMALRGPPLGSKPGGGLALPPRTLEEQKKTDTGRTVNGRKVLAGGCSREGHLRLYAEKKQPVDLLFVFGMEGEAMSRAKASPKVAAAVRAWSACMAEKGYRVTDPLESVRSLGLDPESRADLGSARAIAIAKHDVACKKRVKLVPLWYEAEVEFQKELMEKHAETLAQFKREMDERIKKAAAVHGG